MEIHKFVHAFFAVLWPDYKDIPIVNYNSRVVRMIISDTTTKSITYDRN
jgi:hypothetical protein